MSKARQGLEERKIRSSRRYEPTDEESVVRRRESVVDRTDVDEEVDADEDEVNPSRAPLTEEDEADELEDEEVCKGSDDAEEEGDGVDEGSASSTMRRAAVLKKYV